MTTYPALTLWQPWASLIFSGHKSHETRGFRLPDRLVGEVVAIHAAARSIRPYELGDLDRLCREWWGRSYEVDLPVRSILGVVRFASPIETEKANPNNIDDRTAGDWSPGRWAWPIVAKQRLDEPIRNVRGRQGWWKVDLEGVTL